jgi:hypothetical protein
MEEHLLTMKDALSSIPCIKINQINKKEIVVYPNVGRYSPKFSFKGFIVYLLHLGFQSIWNRFLFVVSIRTCFPYGYPVFQYPLEKTILHHRSVTVFITFVTTDCASVFSVFIYLFLLCWELDPGTCTCVVVLCH